MNYNKGEYVIMERSQAYYNEKVSKIEHHIKNINRRSIYLRTATLFFKISPLMIR